MLVRGRGQEEAAQAYERAGLTTVSMLNNPAKHAGRRGDTSDWIYCFMKTLWARKGDGPLTILLMEHHDRKQYAVAKHVPLETSVFVQEKRSRELLSRGKATVRLVLRKGRKGGG